MGQRLSSYEVIIPSKQDEKAVLFNGLAGTIDVVSLRIGKLLNESRNNPEVLSRSEFDGIRPTLEKRFHITSKTVNDERLFCSKLAEHYEAEQSSLYGAGHFVILPTYSCNFRCPYCYEHSVMSSDLYGDSSGLMTTKQVENIFTIMSSFPYVEEKAQIEIFGGEPLFKKTLSIVRTIVDCAQSAKRTISATTNGYELDLFEDCLGREKISTLCITVDGPAEIHDRRRITSTGKGTFEKIISNIGMALEKGVDVRLRSNVDATNIDSYLPLLRSFGELGFLDNEHFSVAYGLVKSLPGVKLANGISEVDFFAYLQEQTDNKKLLSIAMQAGEDGMLTDLINNPVAATKTRFCGAVGSSYFFSPDNRIYVCSEVIGQEMYSVGWYDAELHIDEAAISRWRKRKMPHIKECLDCPLIFICSGGCAFRAIASGIPEGPYCDAVKESFDARLKLELRLKGILSW